MCSQCQEINQASCDIAKQGGKFPGSQGARLPRNIQAHTKFFQEFTLFWREFDFKVFPYFLSNEGILPIRHNLQVIFSCHRKKHLGTVYCHRNKFLVTERNLLLRADISYHRTKFLLARRNFLSHDEISCHRMKFLVKGRNFLSQEEISCHRKNFHVTRNLLYSKKVFTRRNCMAKNFPF